MVVNEYEIGTSHKERQIAYREIERERERTKHEVS